MKIDRFAALISRHVAMPVTTVEDAYRAGQDCATFGPDRVNCDLRFFTRADLTAAWQRGKAGDGSTRNVSATPPPIRQP